MSSEWLRSFHFFAANWKGGNFERCNSKPTFERGDGKEDGRVIKQIDFARRHMEVEQIKLIPSKLLLLMSPLVSPQISPEQQ